MEGISDQTFDIILMVIAPITVIIISAIAQWFVKNTLAVTGGLFVLLLIAAVVLSRLLMVPWVILGVWAVVYYLLSYIGALIGTLAYKGYAKWKKKKQ